MKYKYILSLFICSILLGGCSNKLKDDSSITDEDIKNYANKNNNIDLQLLQDLNNYISIMLVSGFEIFNNNEEDKLILKAFNENKDISLSVFNFGKISKTKNDYFSDLKRILTAQQIGFIEQNDSIMYKLQYKKDNNNINEICFVIFSQKNNLYSVCINSKTQSLNNLQNSINSIKINN